MNKKSFYLALFVLLVGIIIIPSTVSAAEPPLIFTGNYFFDIVYDAYNYYDTNNDGKFTQSEIDQIYDLDLSLLDNCRQEDFENLKYFRNAETIRLESAAFTGQVDISNLTNLRSFEVSHVNQTILPQFYYPENLWAYTSPNTTSVYNSLTKMYEDIYQDTNFANFKILTLWLGNPDTLFLGEDSAFNEVNVYTNSNPKMAPGYGNSIVSSNDSIVSVVLSEDPYLNKYTAMANNVGTCKITFTSSICERTKDFTVIEPPKDFYAPENVGNNVGLRMYSDGRVLADNGDLYEVDTTMYAKPMVKALSGVNEYLNNNFGNETMLIRDGNTLNIIFDEYIKQPDESWKASRATIVEANAAHIYDDLRVLFTDGNLYKYDYVSNGSVQTLEPQFIAGNVTEVNEWFYISNGTIWFKEPWSEEIGNTGLNLTHIEDAYANYIKVGDNLYGFYFDSNGYVQYEIISNNFDHFLRNNYGSIYGLLLKDGTYLERIPDGTIVMGQNLGTLLNSFNPTKSYSIKPYYKLYSTGLLTLGQMEALQLTRVDDAREVRNYYTGDVEGIMALRRDGTVWFQFEPFSEWTCILSIPDEPLFDDVPNGKWYTEAIDFVKDNGIMKGYGDGSTFGVNDNIARGQIALMLYRLAGEPSTTGLPNPFTDVQEGKYFTEAVKWAVSVGIAKGKTATTFDPYGNVTRQELAVFLERYANFVEHLPTNVEFDLSKFSDYKSVSSWALGPMKYCAMHEIITGDMALGYPRILPTKFATRAQTAQMFMRFCRYILYIDR